jgi:hypothetical protein
MQRPFSIHIREHSAADAIQFHVADLRQPESFVHLLANADVVNISNVVHLLTIRQRMALYHAVRQHSVPGTRFLIYDQFIGNNEPFNATHFMTVDWIINGVQFRETPQELCEVLLDLGFSEARFRRFSGLPGAVIAARV